MPWRKPYRLSPGGSGWRTLALRKKFPKHHKTLCCKTGQSGDNVMNLQISCNVAGCSFYVLLQEEPALKEQQTPGFQQNLHPVTMVHAISSVQILRQGVKSHQLCIKPRPADTTVISDFVVSVQPASTRQISRTDYDSR